MELLEEIVERLVAIYRAALQRFLDLDQVKHKERFFLYYANELEQRLKKALHLDA